MHFTITTLKAFVSIDKDGDEGIVACLTNQGWLPLIAADDRRLKELYVLASREEFPVSGYKVIQFSVRQDITEDVHKKFKDVDLDV